MLIDEYDLFFELAKWIGTRLISFRRVDSDGREEGRGF